MTATSRAGGQLRVRDDNVELLGEVKSEAFGAWTVAVFSAALTLGRAARAHCTIGAVLLAP
ncbi:MAG: hypothetical protein U0263_36680 [Polyangiaceae bacterium]